MKRNMHSTRETYSDTLGSAELKTEYGVRDELEEIENNNEAFEIEMCSG